MDEKRKKDNERIAIARAFLKAVEETDFEHHEPLDKVLAALPDMKVKVDVNNMEASEMEF